VNTAALTSKPRLLLGLAVIVVAIAAGLFGYLITREDEGPVEYFGAVINDPVPMPDAILTDDDGKPFDLRKETEGYVTLLYVGYTHCPDICPTHLYEMSEAIKRLPKKTAEQVKVVFVTADPERDTPAVMKAYVDTFDPNFIGLTGTRAETDAFQETLGIPVASRTDLGGGNYAVNHAAYVIAFTKDQVAYTVYPSGMGMTEWLNDLPLLVSKGFAP
jgi:protein SCO1/2